MLWNIVDSMWPGREDFGAVVMRSANAFLRIVINDFANGMSDSW